MNGFQCGNSYAFTNADLAPSVVTDRQKAINFLKSLRYKIILIQCAGNSVSDKNTLKAELSTTN